MTKRQDGDFDRDLTFRCIKQRYIWPRHHQEVSLLEYASGVVPCPFFFSFYFLGADPTDHDAGPAAGRLGLPRLVSRPRHFLDEVFS